MSEPAAVAALGVLTLGVVDLAAVAAGAGLALGLLRRVAADVLEALCERSGSADLDAGSASPPASTLDLSLLSAALVGHGNHHTFVSSRFPAVSLLETSVDVESCDIIDVHTHAVNRERAYPSAA